MKVAKQLIIALLFASSAQAIKLEQGIKTHLTEDAFVETSVESRIAADREYMVLVKGGKPVNSQVRDELWKKHFQGSQFFSEYKEHQHERKNLKRQLLINEEELQRMKDQYKKLESKYEQLQMKAEQNEEVQSQIAAKLQGPQALFAEGMEGDEDLGMDITMKGEHFHIAQKDLQEKFKVKKNSKFFATGMDGDEDLGLDIIMKGEPYHIAQTDVKVSHYRQNNGAFANGMNGDEDLGLDITMKGEHYHVAQKDLYRSKVPVSMKFFATGMNGDEDLGLDIIMSGEHYHIVQQHSSSNGQPTQNSFAQAPPNNFSSDDVVDKQLETQKTTLKEHYKNDPNGNLGMTISMGDDTLSIAQKQRGDFK